MSMSGLAASVHSTHGDDDASFNPFLNDPDDEVSSSRHETSQEGVEGSSTQQGEGYEVDNAAQSAVQQEAQEVPLPPEQSQLEQPQRQPQRPTRLTLRDNLDWKDEIKIIDAQKTNEGASTSYIAYIIRSDQGDARRRYSEFESLRDVLSKLHPVLILAPIPPHHSLTDYASKQSKAKEDASVIARRKRMLQIFLNRLARHPIFSEERVFQRFLEPNLPWSEVLHSPPVTLLPKNILKASARTPADPSTSALYAALPGPTSTSSTGSASGYGPQLQEPDQRFLDSELFTNKFSGHLSGSMEKINRRTMKRWSELSADYAELGAVMNGFSLNEGSSGSGIASMQGDQERQAVESLSRAIESTGQAIDSTYLSSNAMLQDWERTFTEPLVEYSQFSNIIKQLLKYRHSKHLQFEMTRDSLENKKGTLEELERSEQEARRLDHALDRALTRGRMGERDGNADGQPGPESSDMGSSNLASSQVRRSQSASSTSGGGKFGFLGALSHTFNGMVDSDPDMTRRNNIGKTREQINQLEGSIQSITSDLRYANQMIQADLDRFQRQKVGDFRKMCLDYTKFHVDTCKKNLDLWKEARKLIEEIDDSPASINSGSAATGMQGQSR